MRHQTGTARVAAARRGAASSGVARPGDDLSGRARALLRAAAEAGVEVARALAGHAALGWWEGVVAAAGASPAALPAAPGPLLSALPQSVVAEARRLGRDLAALPVIEANAVLGRLYAQALPPALRTRQGVFYTPPALAGRLLDKAARAGHDWAAGRVIDPSCGAGAFLVAAADRILAALHTADPAIRLTALGARLRGWDIDPFAAWLAQVAVEAMALPAVVASSRRLPPVAETRDTLNLFEDGADAWDLVVGNPPFGKLKDSPPIRARFRRSLYGHPNLYGLFLDLGVRLARPQGGIVAYLTPASFLAGSYFRNLRRVLHTEAPPVSIDLVESRRDVFEDVLQEVAHSAFRRGPGTRRAACAVVHATPAGLRVEPTGTLLLPADPAGAWVFPRHSGDAALVERLHAMPTRLADWGYSVSTGPLVWNRHKPRLHVTRRPGCVPVVWSEAVTQDGRFELRTTRPTHSPWFTPRGPDDPNLVDRACVLVQRTTAKEQPRRLVSAEMPASLIRQYGQVAVENHLNMVRPHTRRPRVPVRMVAAFLATATADRVLRCINASVAVSATELEAMPLPTAEAVIAAMGAPDPEAAVRRLYGLPG
jgi:adenine-specific DNA-methyltransferase